MFEGMGRSQVTRKVIIILYGIISYLIANYAIVKVGPSCITANVISSFACIIIIFPIFNYISATRIIKCTAFIAIAYLPPFLYSHILSLVFVILSTLFATKKRRKHVIFNDTNMDLAAIHKKIQSNEFYTIFNVNSHEILMVKQNPILGVFEEVKIWTERSDLHLIGNEKHLKSICPKIIGQCMAEVEIDMAEYIEE